MNGYELSRNWFDFAFENNSKVTANHGMLFFWLIEINNRLGWAKEFQITAKECMQGMGCHSHNTYKKCLDDLIEWDFIILKRKAVNQFQTNIIALSKNDKAQYKALDKALTKHGTKQSESTVQSTDSIHKPINKETKKHILQKFIIEEDLSNVMKLSKQLTEKEAIKLEEDYTMRDINKLLLQMENYKLLPKKNTSVNLTIRNWLGRDGVQKMNADEIKRQADMKKYSM